MSANQMQQSPTFIAPPQLQIPSVFYGTMDITRSINSSVATHLPSLRTILLTQGAFEVIIHLGKEHECVYAIAPRVFNLF